MDTARLDEAIDAFRRAIALRPDYAEAHNNLGNVFKDQGRLDEALACFRRALEARPDFAPAASNLLFTLHYHSGYDAQAILAEHRAWARRVAEPLAAQIRHPRQRPRTGPEAEGRIRLARLPRPPRRTVAPVAACPSRPPADRGRLLLRRGDGRRDDPATQGPGRPLARFSGLDDAQVADRIRGDRIDILVDLALHTAGNRMLVFARKPAPVQMTMLGMPATTGLATIDYRLTDPYLDPPGPSDGDYTERSIRLPHCFWCYQPTGRDAAGRPTTGA